MKPSTKRIHWLRGPRVLTATDNVQRVVRQLRASPAIVSRVGGRRGAAGLLLMGDDSGHRRLAGGLFAVAEHLAEERPDHDRGRIDRSAKQVAMLGEGALDPLGGTQSRERQTRLRKKGPGDAQQLRADDFQTIRALIESYVCLTQAVGDKNTTIRRLRQMLFGVKTEKTAAVIDSPLAADETTPGPEGEATLLTTSSAGEAEGDSQTPVRGHGRNGAEDYVGAEKIEVSHPSLAPGDPCPQCKTGTVYDTGRPGVVVRLVGQAPVGAKVYYLQKLRCHLCGVVFTAELPQAAGEEKYDATVGSMIALLKYGTGVPFNRAEMLEGSLGIPLPASTQWDLVAAQAERAEPVFGELVRQAAQGDVLHNDDTTVKILELMDKRAPTSGLGRGILRRGGGRLRRNERHPRGPQRRDGAHGHVHLRHWRISFGIGRS